MIIIYTDTVTGQQETVPMAMIGGIGQVNWIRDHISIGDVTVTIDVEA